MTWMSASARVIVIPHEFLWRVPFEAMPIENGYLAETSAVRYAQSLSALVRVPPRQAAAIGGDVNLLIGSAPELHEEVRARVARTAPGWTLRSADGAAFEAKAVSGEAPAAHVTALAGADLTEAALRAHFASAGAIHLAAPFRINSSGPVFSRVLLAGAAAGEAPPAVHDSTDDGSLDPREVMNLQLAARAIVLSDGTAMMMRDAADGAPVVHWAWRAAGVPSLLMPRWSGDADAANQLLADFHSRLRHGESPDEALAAAQRALRLSHERAAPHHWAGWLLLNVR